MSDMDYKIFAAKTPDGRYSKRILHFLRGNEKWIDDNDPPYEEVHRMIRQLEEVRGRNYYWTTDLQEAELWDQNHIARWKHVYPEFQFIELNVHAVPAPAIGEGHTWRNYAVLAVYAIMVPIFLMRGDEVSLALQLISAMAIWLLLHNLHEWLVKKSWI